MTLPLLANAVVYDEETFPNCFLLHWEFLDAPQSQTYEISEFRDDRVALLHWFGHIIHNRICMIGFNNIGFDYPILHWLWNNPAATVGQIYDRSQQIIHGDRFSNTIWESDRLAPQIDLFKINHFDNRAKTTSLKALEVNMRSDNVVESGIAFGSHLTPEQIDTDTRPYCRHDVSETKRFAHYCMSAVAFRAGLIDQFGMDVLNYNDTKIGAKILEQRLGKDLCYSYENGRRQIRQTPRRQIALGEIIFPYISFSNPEFQRILDYMRAQVLTPEDLTDPDATIQTKGVFTDLAAHVGGIDFHFGTGGVHGSTTGRHVAGGGWIIRDIDVEGLYPSIAIANQLAPEHLGSAFVVEYARLPAERKLHPKGTVENGAFKLAANGTYGNSNNKYSPFYDPKFTMRITINGQLMLCMLAEWLADVPTLEFLAANTDGITYKVREEYEPQAAILCRMWEAQTGLRLESVDYSLYFASDVNTYLAQTTSGKVKQKGRLWHPAADDYAGSIAVAGCWHKDLSNVASTRAAVQSMLTGCDPEEWLRAHTDPFDFMCRIRGSRLLWGEENVQKTFRYYVSRDGKPLTKVDPPAGPEGAYKRAPRITELEYRRVMTETGGEWDARVCTANRSRYAERRTSIQAGYLVSPCNRADDFDWNRLDWSWYVAEARKLIVD